MEEKEGIQWANRRKEEMEKDLISNVLQNAVEESLFGRDVISVGRSVGLDGVVMFKVRRHWHVN